MTLFWYLVAAGANALMLGLAGAGWFYLILKGGG